MRAVVIYESLTGNTAKAAEHIGERLSREGVPTTVFPTTLIDFQAWRRCAAGASRWPTPTS